MHVAITVWEDRISPVFDAATTVLVAEVRRAAVCKRSFFRFDPNDINGLLRLLEDQQVQVLICGAVSEEPASRLEASGLQLVPFITGRVDEVLQNCCRNSPVWTPLKMPGCGRNVCCRGRIRRGRQL